MLIKPPLLFTFIYLFASILFFFFFYRIWFYTDKIRNEYLASISKLPSWFPFRNYYIRRINKKSWEIEQKILSVIALIVILGSDLVLITAFFFGK